MPRVGTLHDNRPSKICTSCNNLVPLDNFSHTNSVFYPDGKLPICNNCINSYLKSQRYDWDSIDKLCQYIDIPFSPEVFTKLLEGNGQNVFPKYIEYCQKEEYEGIGWKPYFEAYKKLEQEGLLENELPKIKEEKYKKLQEKWGHNYSAEDLDYLENLHIGLLNTQNITGALQDDQGLKLCKMSLEIDNKIRDGADFDKLLSSYDKLIKTANFTPKNAKSATDLESVGEVLKYFERGGFKNPFYDGVTRDIVDETIKNIQSSNRNLYINEGNIGEEITARIDALKSVASMEKYYLDEESTEEELDNYDSQGYEKLILEEEGDFLPETER